MIQRLPPLLPRDLDHVHAGMGELWLQFRDRRIFISGATGFIGKWLLASLLDAERKLRLGCRITLLSRDPQRLRAACPELIEPSCVEVLTGDVRSFALPTQAFDYVIHAATDVARPGDALDVFSTCIAGTQRMLDLATASQARGFLLLSSGAVYGRQPPELAALREDDCFAPDSANPKSAYGEGKRGAELLCAAYREKHGLPVKMARCFAFIGPYLPLDRQFAVGNFLRDALAGKTIEMQSDGSALRTYLYAADLAVWLWTVLLQGGSGKVYNVGGAEPVSIGELARTISRLLGGPGVRCTGAPSARPPERYVPDVGRAGRELGLQPRIALEEAILRTVEWHNQTAGPNGAARPEAAPR